MTVKPVALIAAGIVLALTAQFPFEGLADQSDLAHWIQHGLLFWSGILTAWGAVLLYQKGQRST